MKKEMNGTKGFSRTLQPHVRSFHLVQLKMHIANTRYLVRCPENWNNRVTIPQHRPSIRRFLLIDTVTIRILAYLALEYYPGSYSCNYHTSLGRQKSEPESPATNSAIPIDEIRTLLIRYQY